MIIYHPDEWAYFWIQVEYQNNKEGNYERLFQKLARDNIFNDPVGANDSIVNDSWWNL